MWYSCDDVGGRGCVIFCDDVGGERVCDIL